MSEPHVRVWRWTVPLLGLLVLSCACVLMWRFGGSVVGGRPVAVAAGTGAPAYPVGACLYETRGARGEGDRPTLHNVDCSDPRAVLMINGAVTEPGGCATAADFAHYGLTQYDGDSRVYYCMSLVVPEQACFVIGRQVPPHRVDCGSTVGAERVAVVRRAASADAACAELPGVADIWYYRSPGSGAFACLVRDTP